MEGRFWLFTGKQQNKKIENRAKKALVAAKEIETRVYPITDRPSTIVRSLSYGCPGDEGPAQIETAADMHKTPHDEKRNLGDNFYPSGLLKPHDHRFLSQYHNLYPRGVLKPDNAKYIPNIEHLLNTKPSPDDASKPTYVTRGNHDGNWTSVEKFKEKGVMSWISSLEPFGEKVEINQTAHTYLFKGSRKTFNKKNLSVKEQLPWMSLGPKGFFATAENKLLNIHLNTNTFAKDYMEYCLLLRQGKPFDPKQNQIAWLVAKYKKAQKKGMTVDFYQHHPFFCYGKRAYLDGWDGHIYFKEDKKNKESKANLDIKKLDLILQFPPDAPIVGEILDAKSEEDLFNISGVTRYSEHLIERSVKVAGFPTPFKEVTIDHSWALRKMIFSHLGICPTRVYSAHEHLLHLSTHVIEVRTEKGIEQHLMTQIGSGGAGGELQEHTYFGGAGPEPRHDETLLTPTINEKESELSVTDEKANYPSQERSVSFYNDTEVLGFIAAENGYFVTEYDTEHPDVAIIEAHILNRPILKFNSLDISEPLRKQSSEDVQSLRLCVLRAIKNYYAFLHERQMANNGNFFSFLINTTHKIEHVQIANKIKNYLNQHEKIEFAETIRYLHEECLSKKAGDLSEHSLFLMVNSEIESFYQRSLEDMYNELYQEPDTELEESYSAPRRDFF